MTADGAELLALKGKEEYSQRCNEKVAKYEKLVGCTLPEKGTDGKVIEYPNDEKGNKITKFRNEDIQNMKKMCNK